MKKEKTWEYDGLIWEFFRGWWSGYETRVFIRSRKERTLAAKMPKEYGRKVGDWRDVEKFFYRLFVPIKIRRNSRVRSEIPCFCYYIHLNRHRSFSTVSPTDIREVVTWNNKVPTYLSLCA